MGTTCDFRIVVGMDILSVARSDQEKKLILSNLESYQLVFS